MENENVSSIASELSKVGRSLPVGKRLPDSIYVHVSVADEHPPLRQLLERARSLACIEADAVNVVKLPLRGGTKLSLLSYPGFFDDAFPELQASWVVDLASGSASSRTYSHHVSRPILHRKEMLLPANDARRAAFAALTAAAEAEGLFTHTNSIGTSAAWSERLAAQGLQVDGHSLAPTMAPPATHRPSQNTVEVHRHKTAMVRYALSTPMQALWRHGFLSAAHSVFDYGCGRGDDLSAIQAEGISAAGWDPHFAPDRPRHEADVVNLGFVLNVIEDLAERRQALRSAYTLARKVLAVGVLIGGRAEYERYRLFRDGILTQRGTFQKYFSQPEIRSYLAEELGREPVAIAPGIFFVFREDTDEQAFLESRQRSARPLSLAPSVPRMRPEPSARSPRVRKPSKWEIHRELLDTFYERIIELARTPDEIEFSRWDELRTSLGTTGRIVRHLFEERGTAEYEAARAARRNDLLVYLAINFFEKRRSGGTLSATARRDVREHWGSVTAAEKLAKELLFSIASVDTIAAACTEAAAAGYGHLDGEHNLQFAGELAIRLPPVLRVYLGCAAQLYGEVESADLVKIHITSGKVSLLNFDDFDGSAVPLLVERVKVDMRKQQIVFFEYGERRPQLLYLKARFMHPSMAAYGEQLRTDKALEATGLFDFTGYGPEAKAFKTALSDAGLDVIGLRLTKKRRTFATRPL